MKYCFCLIFLLVCCLACNKDKTNFVKTPITPSKIDRLNTEEEVQDFVQRLDYPFYRYRDFDDSIKIYKALKKFQLRKIKDFQRGHDDIAKKIADSLNVTRSFYKADIDNNGYTDMVIIGDDKSCSGGESGSCDYSVYALMNFGNDSINPVSLIRRDFGRNAIVPKINETNGRTTLEIFEPPSYYFLSQKISGVKKTELAYKSGSFVEYNDNPKKYTIEKIEYKTEACFGSCPIFELTINNDYTASLNAIEFNSLEPKLWEYEISRKLKGQFKTVIDKKTYQEIIGLLNYLDFPTLEDQYWIPATDLSRCKLTITYNQGKTKTIYDYGKTGTLGLTKIYGLIANLRTNQKWKQATTYVDSIPNPK